MSVVASEQENFEGCAEGKNAIAHSIFPSFFKPQSQPGSLSLTLGWLYMSTLPIGIP